MASSICRSAWSAQKAARKDVLNPHLMVARTLSTSSPSSAPAIEDATSPGDSSKQTENPILNVQTFTGVRNMAHGLHILRSIERKYGPIESYLFPREAGTGEYHPTFLFRFRDPNSFKRLTKPYTRLEVSLLPSEVKPNHTIGLNDVRHLILPASCEGTPSEDLPAIEIALREKEILDSTGKGPNLKSRFAPRIAVSDKSDYPQPFFSHKVVNPEDKPRIDRALSTWRGAAGESRTGGSASRGTLGELLSETLGVPQNTVVLPQKKTNQLVGQDADNAPGQADRPPAPPIEYQLFKVHSRRNVRQTHEDPSSGSPSSAEVSPEGDSSIDRSAANNDPATAAPANPAQISSSKRSRQLEQMRRAAAAAKARSIAELQKTLEAAAKQPETESEAQAPTPQKESSMWVRFLGR